MKPSSHIERFIASHTGAPVRPCGIRLSTWATLLVLSVACWGAVIGLAVWVLG